MSDEPTYNELALRVRQLEKKLAASKKIKAGDAQHRTELETLFEKAPVVMLIVDRDRRVTSLNAAAAAMTRRQQTAAIGLRGGEALRCIHAYNDPRGCGFSAACETCIIRNTVLNTFATGEDHLSVEAPIPYDAGNETVGMWVLISTTLLQQSQGERVLVCLEDISERKQTEEKMAVYSNIVSSTPDGISFIDEHYRYVTVNKAYETYSGIEKNKIIGRTVADYLGAEAFQRHVKPRFDRCLQGETINYQEWFDFPAQGTRFINVTYFPYRDGRGTITGIVANTRDITEQKQLEIALEENEARLNAVQKLSKVGGWEWNVENESAFWTDELYRIHGLEPQSISPQTNEFIEKSLERYDPSDRPTMLTAFIKCIYEGVPYDLEFPFTKLSGERIWVRTSAKPVLEGDRIAKVIGYTIDISERKQSEIALQASYHAIAIRAEVTQLFLTAPRDQVFADILTLLRDEFASRHGYFGYIDQNGDLLCPSMTWDVWSECQPPQKSIVFPEDRWRGIWGESLRQKRSRRCNSNLAPPAGHVELFNALVVPMIVKDELIGQIALANKSTGYTLEDQQQLESIAEFMAPTLKIFLDKEHAEKALRSHARELEEKNIALKVLLENREEEKRKLTDSILDKFEKLVFPYYERLKTSRDKADIATIVSIVETNTQECLAALDKSFSSIYRAFTPMEIQVADLIKAGKTSKEIAAILHISPRSVFFHRNNIRKKLNIRNQKTNLKTFLASSS